MGFSTRWDIACTLVLTAMSVLSATARAEDLLPARTEVAGSRAQPAFESDGIRLGSWIAAPEVQVKTGYESNLFGLEQEAKSDGYAALSATFRLSSDWERHGIGVSGRTDLIRFFCFDQQNTEEFAVRAAGHVDLDHLVVQASASVSRVAERRGINGTPLTLGQPSLHRSLAQSLDLRRESGPVLIGVSISHQDLSFSELTAPDGTIVSQQFRDSDQWEFKARATYTPSDRSSLSLYALYQRGQVPFPNNFANETLSAGGAMAIDTGVARLGAEMGYLKRRLSNPAFKDFDGWIYNGSLSWYPTPLLTLTARVGKSLENSGVPTVGTIISRSYRLEADYEFLRNMLVQANFSLRRERFPEIGRSADSRVQEIKSEFRFNRVVAIGAYGRHECKNSSVTFTVRRFCASSTGLSLTFRR